MKRIVLLMALMAYMSISGCAFFSDEEEEPTDQSLYQEAKDLEDSADYIRALEKYDELIATYPASYYSQQALLDIAYLHYNNREYELALDSSDRFIATHPDHESIDYALYIKGLAYFRDEQNFLDRFGFQDPTERDTEAMKQAFEVFNLLVEQYPNSIYVEDSIYRLRYLVNALATSQIHIARYYFRRKAFLATIYRAQRVLNEFPDSIATKDALIILLDAYSMMGDNLNLQRTQKLFATNFPDEPIPLIEK